MKHLDTIKTLAGRFLILAPLNGSKLIAIKLDAIYEIAPTTRCTPSNWEGDEDPTSIIIFSQGNTEGSVLVMETVPEILKAIKI